MSGERDGGMQERDCIGGKADRTGCGCGGNRDPDVTAPMAAGAVMPIPRAQMGGEKGGHTAAEHTVGGC